MKKNNSVINKLTKELLVKDEQEIKKLARQKQQQQHQSRTFLIESSFDTNSSFSSTFNQLTIETKQIDYKKLFVGNLPSSTKLEEIIHLLSSKFTKD
jgi:hypothetical protein